MVEFIRRRRGFNDRGLSDINGLSKYEGVLKAHKIIYSEQDSLIMLDILNSLIMLIKTNVRLLDSPQSQPL